MVYDDLSLDIDETSYHEALANTWRRQALAILRDAESPMSLADLAKEVAGHEQERPRAEPDEELIECIYISLYHAHIPKLEALDLVEFRPEERTVAPVW